MSLFELIGAVAAAVAVFGYLNHRFVGLPDSIGIAAVGMVVSLAVALAGPMVPGAVTTAAAYAANIDMPEVVFHGLLSVLLFAGSLHINIADLARQRVSVGVLSTLGVVLSTAVVGVGAWLVLAALGHPAALVHCLLFGALISPTDPIAVLGILKRAQVPKALEMKIAGESLFNDGTSVVAFLVLLGVANGTLHPTPGGIAMLLATEVLGGIGVGLVTGWGAYLLLKGVDSYPVEILITLAVATAGYSVAERLHVSAPIAVVVSGLVIGNVGAHAMSATTREHLFSFWELIDEVLNLLLFGLVGLQLLALARSDGSWLLALPLVPVVLLARFVSVGVPAAMLGPWLRRTPHGVKVLTWGGLRGGISVALALSLPEFPGRDTFVMATYAVVLFSLLVQATTLGRLLHRLGLDRGGASGAA